MMCFNCNDLNIYDDFIHLWQRLNLNQMKNQINHLPEHKQQELNGIVEFLKEELDLDMLILFGLKDIEKNNTNVDLKLIKFYP